MQPCIHCRPREVSARHEIRRYGFHGISHRYTSIRYSQLTGKPVQSINLVTLHLEGGSSAAAIRQGRSVDTLHGLHPAGGIDDGSALRRHRSGHVTYLMKKETMSPQQVQTFLNKKCGLLAVSGKSADTRELINNLDDPSDGLALEMFAYRVRKYVGAYRAALGGVEAILVGGGIGENSPLVREGNSFP